MIQVPDDLLRFLKSIGYNKDALMGASITKVGLNKVKEVFNVYLSIPNVLDIKDANHLFLCAQNGINGNTKCNIHISYDNVTENDINNYIKYFIDEIVISRPSLISIVDNEILIEDNTITFKVLSSAEKKALKEETKNLVKKLEEYGIGTFNIDIITDSEKRKELKEQIKNEKNNVPKVEKSPVILGSHKEGAVTKLNNILGETKNIIVEVYIFAKEFVERQGKKGPIYILNLKVSDKTDSFLMKLVGYDEQQFSALSKELNEGSWYRIHGNVEMDTYLKSMIINAKNIEHIESKDVSVKDEADEKRVELHAHTMMSMMDSVVRPDELVKLAHSLGHKAVAITDHNVLQAYPDVYNTVQKINKGKEDKDKFKALYGVELNVVDLDSNIVFNNKEYDLFDQEYVVYDTETTGLNYGVDQMIEIGAVKIKGDKVIDRFDKLISCDKPLPKIITELTSITDEMLKGCDDEATVTKEFLDFCGDLPLVAHNAAFDIAFVSNAMKKYDLGDFNYTVIDTMGLARNMHPEWRNHKLSTLVKNLEVEWDEDKHHRADYDCEGTAKCLTKMLNELKNQNYRTTLDLEKLTDKEKTMRFSRPFHLTLIAKNSIGLKNLFKIISLANTKYLYKGSEPKLPRNDLIDLKNGLIIGSGCINGEVFDKGINLTDEELADLMNFYDYIEVYPASSCSHLIGLNQRFHSELEYQNYIKRLIKIAKQQGKMVCATGDVHNLYPEDLIYRKVIVHQKTNGRLHPLNRKDLELPNMCFLTTEQMLDAFSFLDEDLRKEIVITNPNAIADMCEQLQIIKDKLYTPVLDNSADKCKAMVYNKAHEIYGEKLPVIIEDRLEAELNGIIGGGFDVIYLIAEKLVKKSNSDGYFVGSRGSVGSSLAATMFGITEVNPLPPHYRCPNCRHFELVPDDSGIESGYDLEDKFCPVCGTKMKGDGQNIPFQTFLGFNAEKIPDIDLNFPSDYQHRAFDLTKEFFGEDNVFRAGTIGKVEEKTAFGYVKGYYERKFMNQGMSNEEAREEVKNIPNPIIEYLASKATDVKRTTGQHAGGVMVLPKGLSIYDFTPIQYPADDKESTWLTTHFDYRALHDALLKLDLLGHVDPLALRLMSEISGVDVLSIPLNDKRVISLFTSDKALERKYNHLNVTIGASGLPEFGTETCRDILVVAKPQTFSDLVIVAGLAHGTDVWNNNARDLIVDKVATLNEVIGCRDDIMTYLIKKGLPNQISFSIMEDVRKGKGGFKNNEKKYIPVMKAHGVPDWYIDSCYKIKYMFPKAHAVAYTTMAVRVGYFKVYYPLEFYAVWFTVRAKAYDIETMIKGYDAIVRRYDELKARSSGKGEKLSPKESDILKMLVVAIEMEERGYTFANVDLYKSHATDFVVDKEHRQLIPPFVVMDGLGESAAISVVEARKEREFTSQEDLLERTKLSSTNVKQLMDIGAIKGLSESDQMSLFEFGLDFGD